MIPFPSHFHGDRQQNPDSGTRYDMPLLLSVGILLFVGMILMMSSSSAIAYARDGHTLSIFLKHMARVGIGLLFMAGFAFYDYHHLKRIAWPLLSAILVLLIVVLFWPLKDGATSHRQLFWGPLALQPAELAKFALILFLAYQLSLRHSTPGESAERTFLIRALLATAVVVGLISLETNISMAVLILVSAVSLLFLGGTSLKTLGLAALASSAAMILVIQVVPYAQGRLSGYVAGLLQPSQTCFHTRQSLIGLGKGGLWGDGLGQSTWAHFRLPIPYKDSIFCILGEEAGFVGCIALLAVFAAFLWRGMHIARRAPDSFGYHLACGLLVVLACTFFINVGVTVGLLPPTGQPLPFVSYGGSSLVVSLACVGILLNISRQATLSTEYSPEAYDSECT
ncbi:MAG: FtsW/RodA/SpoVE family cell cycle protein [bacterium]